MKVIHTEYSLNNPGHYVPGVVSGNTLYVSGQLSVDPATGKIPEGGIIPEVKQALLNVERVLKAAGAGKQNVVMCRIYIPDASLWGDVNKAYAEFFGDHKPARIVVPCRELHYGCLVEIEATAEVY